MDKKTLRELKAFANFQSDYSSHTRLYKKIVTELDKLTDEKLISCQKNCGKTEPSYNGICLNCGSGLIYG